jgi:dihydrofolate reductase
MHGSREGGTGDPTRDDRPLLYTIFQANREKNKWERRTNMRKLWVKAWMTLDGVFDADTMDHWWPPADEAAVDEARRIGYIVEEYSKGDVYLLGRTTYEMLWPGWSTQTTGDGPGPILNRMKKYVVSTTLETAPWKESTIIRGNVVEELTKLKQQPGKDMIIDGSATLVQSLMGTDLIDEYRFLVVPYIMGSGRRFFPDGTPPTKLRLVESKMLSAGTLALIYQPDKK